MSPPTFDTWFMTRLAQLTAGRPLLDLIVNAGIEIHVFGGIWYAAALFLLWTDATRLHQRQVHARIVIILHASFLAMAIGALAGTLIAWTPPIHRPELGAFYSRFEPNYNANSFPSVSTSVYFAVASGIYPLRRRMGIFLYGTAGLFVGLPRVYVGAHYPTDVVGGFVVGLAAYWLAARFSMRWLTARVVSVPDTHQSWRQVLFHVVLFGWIFEIGTGFHEVLWLTGAIEHYLASG